MKKIIALFLTAAMIFTTAGINVTAGSAGRFPDVQKGDWHFTYVDRLANLGAIEGMPDGKFYPENQITMAEFVKIVVKSTPTIAANNNPYSGIEHWAKDFMAKAETNKLLNQNEYLPEVWDRPILRREMAKVVSRAMEFVLNEDVIADTDFYTAMITDWDTQCGPCKPDIAQAYAK